jgi:hypothetical protein
MQHCSRGCPSCAVPESQIQWSDADKDVGVVALPVTWKVRQVLQQFT